MSFRLPPIHVVEQAYEVRTDVPREEITDKMLENEVKKQAMSVGDSFMVKCFASGYDHGEGTGVSLYKAPYEVTEKKSLFRTRNPDSAAPQSGIETEYRVERTGEWYAFAAGREIEEAERLIAACAVTDPPKLSRNRKWNPGRKIHEIWLGDEIIFESSDMVVAKGVEAGGPIPVPA